MTLPRVHAVTDARVLGAPDLEARTRSLARHGTALAVHVRDRSANAHALVARARDVTGWLAGSGVMVVVSGRPDIARAVGARGVQLGIGDLAPADARAVYPGVVVGRSVHSLAELREAGLQGADYALLGPVFPTATHPDAVPLGTAPLPAGNVPVLAIGGITLQRVPAVRRAGFHGVAAIRAIWDAPVPGDMVEAMLSAGRES